MSQLQVDALPAKQRKLIAAMREATNSSDWEWLNGNMIRLVEGPFETPQWARDGGYWPGETYNRVTFVTFLAGKTPHVILGITKAPWAGRTDSRVTIQRALDVIDGRGSW